MVWTHHILDNQIEPYYILLLSVFLSGFVELHVVSLSLWELLQNNFAWNEVKIFLTDKLVQL